MSSTTVSVWLKRLALLGVYGGLLMPLIFIKELIFPFVFSKLIFFQILIGITFPAYVLLAWIEPRYRPRKHPLVIAIAAYFVALLLSTVFSVDPLRSWWGNQERMNGLFTLLHFFAWFLMTTSLVRTWKEWEGVLRAQVIIGGLVALTAIWQRWVNPEVFLYKASSRVGGILDNPIYQGMYQMFMLFLLALLSLKTKAKEWWLTYGLLALLAVGGFVASQSRGPLVGLFAGLFVSALCFGALSKDRRYRYTAFGSVVAAVAAYGALYLARGTAFVQELGLNRFVDFSSTSSTRLIAWKIAWQGFIDRPITGWGLDTFHLIFNANYNPISLRYSLYETWFDRAHNTVLDVLSMTGVVGILTFAAIFGTLFWSVYRAYKKGELDLSFTALLAGLPVAYFVQNLFVFDHPAGFVLSYLLYALVVGATTAGFMDREPSSVGDRPARPFPVVGAVVLGLASLLLVWRGSVQPAQASRLSIRASQRFPQAIALEDMQAAMRIATPYRDEQVFLLSRALVGVGDQLTKVPNWSAWLDIAKRAGAEEMQRHPRNAYLGYIYARLLGDTSFAVPGQDALAEAEYKRAIEASPRRQQLFEGLGRLYLRQGRLDDAIAQFEIIRGLDTESGYGDWLLGVVKTFDLQQEPEGAALIVASLEKPYPNQPANLRELVPVFYAYRILGRGVDLDRWASQVTDDKTAGEGPFYQFAYQSRLAKRSDLEERFMVQGERLFPGFREKYLQAAKELESANK